MNKAHTTYMHELLIWADGGLGNRLRPLLSCMSIVENTNTKLIVVWRYTRTCQINLESLFSLKSRDENNVVKNHFVYMTNPNTPSQIRDVGLPINISYHADKIDEFVGNSDVLINTPYWLKSKYIDYSQFPRIFHSILLPETVTQCLEIKRQHNVDKTVIGCHLRSTDLHNPTKLKQITHMFEIQNQQRFFICADNENTEELCRGYSNVIIIDKTSYVKLHNEENTSWSRNCLRDEISVKQALIDLCVLSMCDISDNSYHTIPESTFLDVARKVAGWEKYLS